MKIGVVSDTHCYPLPRVMLEDFKKTDLILHAGDLCSIEVLEELRKIKDVKAVWGNMDDDQLRKVLPRTEIVRCGAFSIGLFHGQGNPANLMDVVKREFKNKDVQAIVFGHSHHPMNERINETLFFNPGSPNDLVFAPFRSYGILDINDEIKGQIIRIN